MLVAFGVALSAFTVGTFATSAAAAGGSGDFNGDGRTDLAIGAPFRDVDGKSNAGAVKELRGTPTGFTPRRVWHQDKLRGTAEAGDRFGSALAAGNFNGDEFADLAIGVPYEDVPGFPPPVGGKVNAGAVNVLYGSPTGLRAANNRFWTQDDKGTQDDKDVEFAQPGDRFGSALTAGDFNNDGVADLAIGVPYEDLPGKQDAGAVNVLYGFKDGLGAHGPFSRPFWHQDVPGVKSVARAGDRFGSALAAANFGISSEEDLAIGVPGENVEGVPNAGAVNVLYGSSSDLTVNANELWHRRVDDVAGVARAGDRFGSALAAANLGRSLEADLAIGAPYADVDGKPNAGSVTVLYGNGAAGLTVTGSDPIWHQNVTDPGRVAGVARAGDRFGSALAATNLVLAIGVPLEDDLVIENGAISVTNAGAVNVIYGDNETGLNATGENAPNDKQWHRKVSGVRGEPAPGDRFGSALVAALVAHNSTDIELAIGAPRVDVDVADAGAVNVLYGSDPSTPTGGLAPDAPPINDQEFDWTAPGFEGGPHPDDRFGAAL